MNRPRVLHLRASNFVGGPEQQLLRYADADRNGPCELLFGTYVGPEEGGEFRDALASRDIEVLSLPKTGILSSIRQLMAILREKEIALVCTHGYKADIVGLIAGQLVGVPVACFLRGWTRENPKVRRHEALDRFFLRFAPRVVCLSRLQANRVSKNLPASARVSVVSNAIDASGVDASLRRAAHTELRRRFQLPNDCKVIAAAARLSPEKGVADFLQAAAQVKKRFAGARFLIFGTGALRDELQEKAIELGLRDHVVLAGFQRDLRKLLPGVDILVNPSHTEEMPNVVLEGMAAGIPVIATRVGGVEEIGGTPPAIRMIEPAEPMAQADAITALLLDPDRAAQLAKAGHNRVLEAYTVEAQRRQFHALYQEMLPSLQVVPAKSPISGGLPFLSIVLPIRNEEAHIRNVLGQLDEQDYPHDRFEVLAAIGASWDKTVQEVERYARATAMSIRIFENPQNLSSAGRNIGARQARGEYVMFVDGHCELQSKTMLRDAVALFEQTGAHCLCRPQPLVADGKTLFQKVVAKARGTALGHGRDSTIFDTSYEGPVNPSSSGALYRRSVFNSVGYYDESFDACEDVEFNYRVFRSGLRSWISPRLTVLYAPRGNAAALWQQMMRYGRGRFRLIQKHREAFSLSQVVPALFVIWLALGTAGSALYRSISLAFLFSLLIYVGVVAYFSATLGRRSDFRSGLLAPLIYLIIHLGLGAGFLAEALKALTVGRTSRGGPIPSRAPRKSASLEPPFSIEM
jgi:succinoglycan biosynthesis protein ExoA